MSVRIPKLTAEEKKDFAVRVKNALDAGGKVWVTVPSTSRSNMSYTIRARIINGETDVWLNYWLAAEMGCRLNDSDDIKHNGIGFDRGFELVCDIAHVLRKHGLAESRFEYEINWGWF